MSTAEWMAEIGKAAEELGYGVVSVSWDRIELVGRQQDSTVIVESRLLSGDYLRALLMPVPHRSGTAYTREFMERAR